jgi:hypothetical protein
MEQTAILLASTLIAHPWLGLVVAGGFAACWWLDGNSFALGSAMGWAGYAGYEYLMLGRILCTGECNIRVDLLLVYPLLLLLSILSVAIGVRNHVVKRRAV